MENWRISCPKCGSYKNHFTGEDWTGYPPDYVCEGCGNVFSRPTPRAADEANARQDNNIIAEEVVAKRVALQKLRR